VSNISTGTLMRDAPAGDALRESLVLADLERQLFDRRVPAPVLDRYVLVEKIGAGGLGVVFRAYDPDLDRQVALKLLRLREGATATKTGTLLEEARLMAKVSHPNVVTVHDVGAYTRRDLGFAAEREDNLGIPTPGVFLVMELMERGSLRDVLRRRPGYREIMPTLLSAGRGVAAAHGCGIVHRDFKPGNVLIGGDGRVRVGDFGLAQPIAHAANGHNDSAGTPAYMAPEQLRGGIADAKSDQYSFALTCYLALYDVHPFSATDSPTLGKERGVPRRIYSVLRRALADEPAERYPDMPALLRALESATINRGRRALAGVAVAMTTIASALLIADSAASDPADPCAAAGAAVRSVWNADVRRDLQAGFRSTGAPFAESSGGSVLRALDAYAARWQDASREACLDTHVRHVQSADLLDARTACLERRRLELGAAVRLMTDADPELLANAVPVVHGLGWLGGCNDPTRDSFSRSLPDDPAARTAATQLWEQLGQARLLELAGRYAEAAALATAAADDAAEMSDGAIAAAARLRIGSIAGHRGSYAQARTDLLRAVQLAEAASDDALVADGWIRLVWIAGVELDDPEGETWAGFARAALARLGGDPMREAQLDHNLGGMAYRNKRFDEALAHYQSALRAQRELLAADDPKVARTLNHIANVLLEIKEPERALSFARRSLATRETTLGRAHPLVAASLNNVASACLQLRRLPCAQQAATRAVAITEGHELPELSVARRLQRMISKAAAEAAPQPGPAVAQ